MPDLVPVKRALLSVSDKTGLVDFATTLQKKYGVNLLSTGGTAKALRDAGLSVTDVSDVTGFPEMMDGRVKTLHPKIHGGLLAVRDDPAHAAAMKEHGIEPIDLVVINLYPFEQTIAKPGVTFDEAIENIDIGGPSMVRSAAKNHAYVAVVTAPEQYKKVLGDLAKHGGSTCSKHRRKLAVRAFQITGLYDFAITQYLNDAVKDLDPDQDLLRPLPPRRMPVKLRYGENPHQSADLRVERDFGGTASVAYATQHHGKELSYINVLDADAALACVKEFDSPAACVVKHATPCGVATAAAVARAVDAAYACDPVAAFGGIVAVNVPLDKPAAEALTARQKFLEVIVAPSFEPGALDLLKARWKNVRLLEVGPMFTEDDVHRLHREGPSDEPTFVTQSGVVSGPRVMPAVYLQERSIVGGQLRQVADFYGVIESEWKAVSKRPPTPAEMSDLKIAWLAVKHVKSNAITIAKDAATVGIGGGQVDRVGAARIAIEKAGERARGAVAASDAFFPFPDGPKLLIDAGVTAIVQPGGSVRDAETIGLCDERGVALVFTGRRHFRH
jgi:phosphoribosylaminoimidazolecarboxamide formyltransferase/IMP cyclohydrolase